MLFSDVYDRLNAAGFSRDYASDQQLLKRDVIRVFTQAGWNVTYYDRYKDPHPSYFCFSKPEGN